MTLLGWRDANLRSPADKKCLQHFRCTDEDLKTEITAVGASYTHSRMWEWHVQELIRNDVRSLSARRWLIRLGFDDAGLGAVMVAEEIDPGEHFYLSVGAIASRLRRQHSGALGDEMLEDTFAAIGERCLAAGYSGEVRLTGIVHRDNYASKRMCERNGFTFRGDSAEVEDHENWGRSIPIPELPLFDGDFDTNSSPPT